MIFEDLNWDINSNENWVISGNNAAGKSSLSEVLSGKHFARKGNIDYSFLAKAVEAGHSIYTLKREQIYRVSLQITTENLIPKITIISNALTHLIMKESE